MQVARARAVRDEGLNQYLGWGNPLRRIPRERGASAALNGCRLHHSRPTAAKKTMKIVARLAALAFGEKSRQNSADTAHPLMRRMEMY
eukprot:scaffold6193_cov123-Isochrysis_galbana.AAC.3